MKVNYKEDPLAWRKNVLFSVLGLLILISLLRWRHVVGVGTWNAALAGLIVIGAAAWVRPHWFRGHYRISTWAGFWSSQLVARLFLALLFVLIIVPAGLIIRLMGKDLLHLKPSREATSYWRPAKGGGSLDRLF